MNIQDVLRFVEQSERFLQHNDPARKTKLSYALARMEKQLRPKIDHYLGDLEDRRVEFCEVDKDGAIRRDANNNFVFTKAGLNNLNKANRELLAKEIEIDPYYATSLPEDLSEAWRVEFEGFVIREEKADHAAAAAAAAVPIYDA